MGEIAGRTQSQKSLIEKFNLKTNITGDDFKKIHAEYKSQMDEVTAKIKEFDPENFEHNLAEIRKEAIKKNRTMG